MTVTIYTRQDHRAGTTVAWSNAGEPRTFPYEAVGFHEHAHAARCYVWATGAGVATTVSSRTPSGTFVHEITIERSPLP